MILFLKETHLSLTKALLEKEKVNEKSIQMKDILSELEAASLDDPNEDKNLQLEENRLVNGVKLQEVLHHGLLVEMI